MPGLKPCGIALFPLSLMRSGLRRRARIKIRFHRREKCRNVQNVSPHVDTKRVVEEHREIESTFRARGKFKNPIFQNFQIFKISKNVKFLFFPKSSMSTPTMFPWPLWPHKRLRNDFPRRGRRSRPTRPEQARSTTYTERRGQRRIQNEQKCENPEL